MQYAWLIWSLILIGVWLAIYFLLDTKEKKREMFVVSFWTSLLGFTEPIFVPEYWSPPSLFDLAMKTGFDVESFIFSFGIGGIAVIIYELIFKTKHEKMNYHEQHSKTPQSFNSASFRAVYFYLASCGDIHQSYLYRNNRNDRRRTVLVVLPSRFKEKNVYQRGNIFRNIFYIFFYAYRDVSGLCGKGLEP